MDKWSDNLPDRLLKAGSRISVSGPLMEQPHLYPLRVSTIYPGGVNGAHVRFRCEADKGGTYYCKDDDGTGPIRATEWFFTQFARHLGVATPDFAVLEDPFTRATFFGSLEVFSPASLFQVRSYLTTPQKDEVGQPMSWLGNYLSGLFVFDMFCFNVDRGMNNFLLHKEGFGYRLCAFDFASARLSSLADCKFPIESDATVRVGRILRQQHGFSYQSAREMIDRIEAVPSDTIGRFLKHMPPDWLTIEQRKGVVELWSGKRLRERLAALRLGIANESLL